MNFYSIIYKECSAMINIDLTFDDERMNFRDPISYYFAKLFYEQFTVDILNSLNIYA